MEDNTVTLTPPESSVLPPVEMGDDTTPTLAPSEQVAQTRSEKVNLGLGSTLELDPREVYADIAAGREPGLRQSLAAKLNFKASQDMENKILEGFKKKGAPLTYDEAQNILAPFDVERKQANPVDVIERAYATKYISALNTADAYMRDTVMTDAAKEIPEELVSKRNTADSLTTTVEFVKTLQEDVANEISKQGYLSWGADVVKRALQPYNEIKLRGNNPEVGKLTGGLLLGENLRNQADAIWDLPIDERLKRITDIVSSLRKDNPSVAQEFLTYILGATGDDRRMNDLFTIMTPLDIEAGGKASLSLLRKIAINNRAGTAFKTMVKEAAKPDTLEIPLKAKMQEASGDVVGSAVSRAQEHIVKTINGTMDPIQDVKESLTSNFRLDGDVFDSNPGNLSKSDLTILKDSFYRAGTGLIDVIRQSLRLNRTPEALMSEDALRAYRNAERARYPGLDNAMLDITSPIHQPETNTYWLGHVFGNLEGRLFSDPETAENFAKRHGFSEIHIEQAIGDVERVPSKFKGSLKDFQAHQALTAELKTSENLLANAKAFTSRKFVGPRTPESIVKAAEDIQYLNKRIPEIRKSLEDVSKKFIKTDPVIEQNGVGYKFTVFRPYRETDDIVRSWAINSDKSKSTASMTGFDSWKNSWLGWVRGADDTLAFNESVNRKIANYTQSLLRRWAKDEAADIEQFANPAKWYKPQTWYKAIGNNQMFQEFNDTLKFAKTAKHPKTGEIGYFFQTPGELQSHYMTYYNRMPTMQETKAYFAHVKILEANRVLSEIAEFRNRARIGTEQHQIHFLDKAGQRVSSGYFDGIEQREFPGGNDQILIMGGHTGDERLYNLGSKGLSPQKVKEMKSMLEKGQAKIIRIYDPDSHPLKDFSEVAGSNRVRYVFTADSDFKPLAMNHVNRRGGGHFDVDADFYVKQAKMVRESFDHPSDKRKVNLATYTGDYTLMPVKNRQMGRDIIKLMNELNGHMRDNRVDEAKALARKLGIDWDTVHGWYQPKTAPNGHVLGPPSIDWNEPFYVVPRDKKIYDIDKSLETRHGLDFKDGTKSGSDALQFQVAYNQARDSENLGQIINEGTHANPLYKYVPAEYVDPIPSLNRAMNRAINSTFMDDYKIHAVEHWLEEAIPHLKADAAEVRASPFWHFNNADRGAFKSATDLNSPGLVDNLLSNRFKIRQFIGMPNKVDTYIHGATQLLVDEFYKRGTPEWLQVVPLWALNKATNPSVLRSFAFNAKLGLFSVPQFLVQAQNFTNIWAISPRAAAHGTAATMFHTWARINAHPDVLKAMDGMLSKMNVFGMKLRPGDFLEARRELARTGFEHVAGEYALADDMMQHNFFKNQFGSFLDAGQVFFKEGEKASRLGAYYTAFFEWRSKNPLVSLTDKIRGEILQRADLLTNNMSRASSSSLNSSLLSLPTQFLSYQVRLAELFWGKRLGGTTAERIAARARLVGFFGAMYGAPSAIGVTGWPFGDSIRQYAINNGYVVGDNQIEDLVMNGYPAWAMAMISGEGDYKKGNQYNVGSRYGSQGLTFMRESMRSDETVWKLIGGAAGSTIVNTITSLDPFWQAAKYLISDDEEGNSFKITPAHIENMFSEFSSADAAKRFIYALHTGRWLSHNESYIENVTGLDALYRTVTGLRSQQQDDIFAMKNIKDQEAEVQKSAEREIIKDYHRGIQATVDGDDATAKTAFTNARARMIAAGIPLERRSELMASASRGYETQIETSVRNWATKNVPYGQEKTRLDAYQRYLQLQDYRNK